MDLNVPASYVPTVGRFDELVDEKGAVRSHWESMVRTWATLGAGEIVRRQTVAERLLVAEGAGHVFHDDREVGVAWGLDPVPYVIGAKEWRDIERGLTQRTRVLDAVLDDLYGARRLLLDGVIPTAAVMGSRAYQLAAVGVATPRPRLVLYAADLVRDSGGRWLLLRDHTDAPTGCGYALMNRTVLSRLYPEPFRHLGVSPLSGWFSDLRSALSAVAPADVTGPRTILLGPKPQRPGFVEASYLATHLGYHLASSGDLITRGGRVWLRTLGGLEQIDVVFRRLADTGSDPLELRPSGLGGVTGLLQSVREGNVGVANSLGSGVADRLWLQPFLADAARHLLGETLELASIDTWWCGDRDKLAVVRADPQAFVLHDTDPVSPAASVFADSLSDADLTDWLERITAAPHRYVVQPKIEFASTPVAVDGELRSGTASIRVQTVRIGDEAIVLPGGHGRHVAPGQLVINSSDAFGKDVWVLTDPTAQRPTTAATIGRRARLPQIDLRDSLPTRSAEALFWLGRNAERAEAASRTARLIIARTGSDPTLLASPWLGHAIAALRAVSGGRPAEREAGATPDGPEALAVEIAAALDDRSGAVANSLRHLAANAGGVREFLSTATWRVLNGLDAERSVLSSTTDRSDPFLVTECLDRIMVDLAALAGLVMESMVRGPGWRFLDLGRRLERAVLLLGVIEATLSDPPADDVAQPVYDLVLGASESLVAYRRRYRSDVRRAAIEDLLVHDDTNPRSLAFQLDRVNEHLAALPWNPDASKHRRFLDAAARGRLGEGPDSLAKLVLGVRGPLLELIRELMLAWFTHPAPRARRCQLMRYRVSHITEYRYSAQVINGHTVAHLRPRQTPTQSVVSSVVTTSPAADHADEYLDAFGNHVSYRAVEQVHDQLVVTGNYEVDIATPEQLLWSPPWEELRGIVATDGSADGLLARMCSIESTFVTPSADLARFASWSFLPGRAFHEAVIDLSHRIFTEFAFDPGFSDVSTPLTEVLTHRRGVCQDFAHLAIGSIRSLGLPARYVSGYIENRPPPGQVKLFGADASHAWCSVYIPGWGWLDVDPTNDQAPPMSHVTVGWGRDYADVAPVRGVVFGSPATQELSVAVEVSRVGE